jgi:predicted amidohydrolase
LALIDLAAAEGADLVLLPELFALQQCAELPSPAEPLAGYVVSALSQAARRHRIGICAGHALLVDGQIRNSLVLFDRQGEIMALYHKAYPTLWELERGVRPGPGAHVCDTEFGRLGFAICFDLNFAELRLQYRDSKLDCLLFGSAFRGGLQTRWWAYEMRSYLVSSAIDPQSLMTNPLGRIVADTDVWSCVVIRTLNLDCEVVHLDYSNAALEAARFKYGQALEMEVAEAEGVLLPTSHDSTGVAALLEEFHRVICTRRCTASSTRAGARSVSTSLLGVGWDYNSTRHAMKFIFAIRVAWGQTSFG